MALIKSIKVAFCLAVLLLVAKPFLGFSVTSQLNTLKGASIYVKAFTKRKQEYVDGSEYSAETFQKKLAEPVAQFLLRLSFLFSIILPFAIISSISNSALRWLHTNFPPRGPSFLLNGSFLI